MNNNATPPEATIDLYLDEGCHRFLTITTPDAPYDTNLSVTTSPHTLVLTGSGTFTFIGPQDMLTFSQQQGVQALKRYLSSASVSQDAALSDVLSQFETALALYARVGSPRLSFSQRYPQRSRTPRNPRMRSVA